MKIDRIDHLNITVADIDRSIEFYLLSPRRRPGPTQPWIPAFAGMTGQSSRCVRLYPLDGPSIVDRHRQDQAEVAERPAGLARPGVEGRLDRSAVVAVFRWPRDRA